MRHGLFGAMMGIAFAVTPAAATEFTTLLTGADGAPFVGVPERAGITADGRHYLFRKSTFGFGAEFDTVGNTRQFLLDVVDRTLRAGPPVSVLVDNATKSTAPLVDGRYAAFITTDHGIDGDVPETFTGDVLYFADLDGGVYDAIPHAPDGTFIEWTERNDRGVLLRPQRFMERGVSISPDARWVVFSSTIGVTADGGNLDTHEWDLYAFDRVAGTALLLTPAGFADNNAYRKFEGTWFLPDGRLVTSLPLEGTGIYEPVVFPTLGAAPVALLPADSLPEGGMVEALSPGGRYLFVGEVSGSLSSFPTLNERWRFDLVTGERVAVCNLCFISGASADGDVVAAGIAGHPAFLKISTGERIEDPLRGTALAPDGRSAYGFRDGLLQRFDLREVSLQPALTAAFSERVFDGRNVHDATFDLEVTNTGDQAAFVILNVALRRNGVAQSVNLNVHGGRTCDHLGFGCTIEAFAPGDVWRARVVKEIASAGDWEVELTVESRRHFLSDPGVAKSSTVLAVPEPEQPQQQPTSPTSPPAVPGRSGGGGSVAWWWLALWSLRAMLSHRNSVSRPRALRACQLGASAPADSCA